MELTLSDNIRTFRKERKLTQEQLAEVLGVTTGAVYKWESGMSVPELNLIVEMADFFDTSVDVLLGYKMKDNRIESVGARLFEYIKEKNTEALPEAEKLLKKYPNNFDVVNSCAQTYLFFASLSGKEEDANRSLELFEQAITLLPQNKNPKINEATIYGDISSCYALKGDKEKCVKLLEEHNAGGMYSGEIGAALAGDLKRPDEGEKYLVQVFLETFGKIFTLVAGYSTVFINRRDYNSALKILDWGINLTKDIKDQETPDFCDKAFAGLYVLKAFAELKLGNREAAKESMQKAVNHAKHFDSSPNYTLGGFKIKIAKGNIGINDGTGATAKASLEKVLKELDSRELTDILNTLE